VTALRREARDIEAQTRAEVEREAEVKIRQAAAEAAWAEKERERMAVEFAKVSMEQNEKERRGTTPKLAEKAEHVTPMTDLSALIGMGDKLEDLYLPVESEFDFLLDKDATESDHEPKQSAPAAQMQVTGALENRPVLQDGGANLPESKGSIRTSAKQRMLSKLKKKTTPIGGTENRAEHNHDPPAPYHDSMGEQPVDERKFHMVQQLTAGILSPTKVLAINGDQI
jgi:hypothetical protein